MGNPANKAQKFLLDNNCGDLILNDRRTTKPEDRIYASDIMMMFLESERGQNIDTSEGQLTIPAVIKSVCDDCTAYPFDERGKTPLCKNCKDNPSQTVL